ncbi:tubby-related protein 3-like [Colossoma macropomum]|uniref:tubby-related protein 3-like n=1 Tax=Colossoma macropomum TaxID=42526 RepID=UPI0018648748|nr:tubby-related protein 3-like [Colossoma macropomum]
MKKNKASSYVISVGEPDEAESVVGTLRSNKKRTEFTLYDDARDPGEINEALLAEACMKELAAISYEKMLGFRRPQQMSVVMPGMDKNLKRRPVYVYTAERTSW